MKNRLKKFKAMVLTCMDPRFQPLVYEYLKKRKLNGKYSSFTIAGGAIGVTHKKFKRWHLAFIENLATSVKIHKIKKLTVEDELLNSNKIGISTLMLFMFLDKKNVLIIKKNCYFKIIYEN